MRIKRIKSALTRRHLLIFLLVLTAVPIFGILLLSRFPGAGAQLAKPLRGIIGNEGVARLETILFTIQDEAKMVRYQAGLAEQEAPWQGTAVALPSPTPIPTPTPTATAPAIFSPTSFPPDAEEHETATSGLLSTSVSTSIPSTPNPIVTPTSTPPPWSPPSILPFGSLVGEGVWQPYLHNSAGEVVAYRTFLQPDEERPYAIAAIVAFDLNKIRLHYVLGSDEPALAEGPHGSGLMNAADKQPGTLLATFNGGFMASNGQYGAMADGLVALAAKDGYATVTIGEDGRVQIGEWGFDIAPDGSYQSWRQNARLITQNGQINERVYNGSAATWGSSINGDIVTWRSGIGLSEDGQILYFVAGPGLSMPTLAAAMSATGAYNSLLLDINETWVHFAAIRTVEDELTAEPLLTDGMDSNVDRYLKQSSRDFFYISAER
ncbi:MAG: phosphodiester glycosidase family protein [Chloroflexi bacterium]|nr:phosphodiester glycosidase family protein [Chloroflexota bacterium]